jgi:hypothetical protein
VFSFFNIFIPGEFTLLKLTCPGNFEAPNLSKSTKNTKTKPPTQVCNLRYILVFLLFQTLLQNYKIIYQLSQKWINQMMQLS